MAYPAPLAASAVTFNAQPWLHWNGPLSGISDGKKATILVFLEKVGTNNAHERIIRSAAALGGATTTFSVNKNSAGAISIQGCNTSGATILSMWSSDNAIKSDCRYRPVLISFDLANDKKHIYLGEQADIASVAAFVNDDIDFTAADWAFGATPNGTNILNGRVARAVVWIGQYIDVSILDNRRLFYTREGLPVDLAQAIAALGTPTVRFDGSATTFADNLGSGGDPALISGPFVNASKSPSDVAVFGYATDVHQSEKDMIDVLHYRGGVEKMRAAVSAWNGRALNFVMFGGDLIDHVGGGEIQALVDLTAIENEYELATANRCYVFGNHCLDKLSKSQIFANTGMSGGYYSFDAGGFHFIVLDACYRSDDDSDHYSAGNFSDVSGYVPPGERTWLAIDLSATDLPCVVFTHQRLTADIINASTVRGILESSGKVMAVLAGHAHINGLQTINGIKYYDMEAMGRGEFPTNAHAVIRVTHSGLQIEGFWGQTSYV